MLLRTTTVPVHYLTRLTSCRDIILGMPDWDSPKALKRQPAGLCVARKATRRILVMSFSLEKKERKKIRLGHLSFSWGWIRSIWSYLHMMSDVDGFDLIYTRLHPSPPLLLLSYCFEQGYCIYSTTQLYKLCRSDIL